MPHSDPPEDADFATRLRHYREQSGMTRATLASRVGRSEDWLKSLERRDRGASLADSVRALLRTADILGVDLADLVGASDQSAMRTLPQHPLLPQVTDALTRRPIDLTEQTAVPIDELHSRTVQAWRAWHTQQRQRTAVAQVLPGLIRDIKVSVALHNSQDPRQTFQMGVRVFALTHLYLSFQGDRVPWALHTVGEWVIGLGQASRDPCTLAAAAWTAAHVQRETGDFGTCLAADAAGLLCPGRSAEEMAMWGLMQVSMALSSGLAGKAGDALRYWDRARGAGSTLGVTYIHPWLQFNAAMIDLMGVYVHVLLAHPGEALRLAERIDTDRIRSWSRRSFLHTVMARAHLMQRDPLRAALCLQRAQREAPEDVALNPLALQVLRDLRASDGSGIAARVRRMLAANRAALQGDECPPAF